MEKRNIGVLPVYLPPDDTPHHFLSIEINGAAKEWLLKKNLEMSPERLFEEVYRIMEGYYKQEMEIDTYVEMVRPDKNSWLHEQRQAYYAAKAKEETIKALVWLKKYTELKSDDRGKSVGEDIPR